jgi:hypothetical protein
MSTPANDGNDGRDTKGRFAPGNKHGLGRPRNQRIDEMRTTMLCSVRHEDIIEVTRALVEKAKRGQIDAIRLLYDRVFGPITAMDVKEEIEQLHEAIRSLQQDEDESKLRTFLEKRFVA